MAAHPDNASRNQYGQFSVNYCVVLVIKPSVVSFRYQDVLPYEENRVKLTPSRENRTGYINASHISAAVGSAQRFYIAAQGPLPSTVTDFWQMVWQSDVYVVVMLADTTSSSNNGGQQTPTHNTKSVSSLRSHVSNSSMNGYSGFIYWPQQDAATLEFGEVLIALLMEYLEFCFYLLLFCCCCGLVQNHAAGWQTIRPSIHHKVRCNSPANSSTTQHLASSIL
jgi:hypothetical protein